MGVIVLLFCCFFNTSTLNIMKPENVYARATDGYDNRTTGGHSIAESNNDNGVETNADDCSILGKDFNDLLKDIFLWIEISVPCITLLLCTIDIAKATISQDEKGIKEAQARAIKRVIIGIIIFFVPTIINFLLKIVGILSGTCGIGG